jgi:cyclase
MFRTTLPTALLLALFASMAGAAPRSEFVFVPPLHPGGAELVPKELGPGVYALVSTRPPVDNSGFVVGERGVLVVDAHINGEMARKIQAAVRQVTDKPILYLVNTNYHGDHTFGNYAFPADTRIVAQRRTAERMREFERARELMSEAVSKDPTVLADVKLRLPDLVFDDALTLDLGGRAVELHHFGFGSTPGDTVVYVPEAKAAWTGNLVLGGGMPPFLLEGHPEEFLVTLARFARTLDVRTIVPGHGPISPGTALASNLDYLATLLQSVRESVDSGRSLEETVSGSPLDERFVPELGEAAPRVLPFYHGVHRQNVWKAYQEIASIQP